MIQEEIDYEDVMKLGFERNDDGGDKVWFNRYGFEYFYVTKDIKKHITADWDVITRKVELLYVDKGYNIKARMKIKDLDRLKEMINFLQGVDNTKTNQNAPIHA
jgi:hypothetical protein